MANEEAAQSEKLYKQDGSIQKVINGLGEQMHDCLAPALDHCISTLIQHGVIDIDVQAFAERYQSFAEPCAEAFNDVYDRYAEVVMDEEELLLEANKWELSHGGLSGRTAQQFIDYLLGKM